MVSRNVVGFVNLDDVLQSMGFDAEAQSAIVDYGFSNICFGSAQYTLIGNTFALHSIVDGIMAYYADLEDGLDYEPSRNIPEVLGVDEIRARFWRVVGPDDFVNLEATH